MLNKPQLKTDIRAILHDLAAEQDENATPDSYWETFSTRLADAIDTFVRSGLVTTTGTSSAQTGSIT